MVFISMLSSSATKFKGQQKKSHTGKDRQTRNHRSNGGEKKHENEHRNDTRKTFSTTSKMARAK